MKKKERKTKKVAIRDLKPRKAAAVKGGQDVPPSPGPVRRSS